MTEHAAAPTPLAERIGELDVIRGFALFGVLLINLYGHSEYALPPARLDALATIAVDRPLGLVFDVLFEGKAQALFSMLFGFGFALFLERAEARGGQGARLYLRRLTFLALLGFAHMWLVFFGDILNAYALTGFMLLLVRRWPAWALLSVGIFLSLFSSVAMGGWLAWVEASTGATPPLVEAWEAGLLRRYDIFLGHDPVAYVAELFRSSGDEWFLSPFAWSYFATVLGRFLIGYWLFRQGWLRRPAEHAALFRRWAPRLLAAGLLLALADVVLDQADMPLTAIGHVAAGVLHRASQVVLALGYGATLVVLLQSQVWRRALSGLAEVGRMALTNYLAQSLVYLFVFYGFGLGLMRYGGALTCLLIAIPTFALQIALSRWWMARYRFGPMEWLWRTATYGERQPFRRERVPPVSA